MAMSGLARAIAVLRLFHRDRRVLTPVDIASELAMPRSTVHRLLSELMDLGLVQRQCDGRYALDSGILTLGFEYLASNDLVGLSGPLLERLRDQTNWSTHLAVRQGRHAIYLSRYPAQAALTRNVSVGSALPAHATVMGRILLTDLEPTELRDLYEDGDAKAVPPCLSDLLHMIDADRARGYAAGDGYFENGVLAVAAPVRDISLKVVAAINAIHVGGTPDMLAPMAAQVVGTAGAISRLLGAPAQLPDIPLVCTGEEMWR